MFFVIAYNFYSLHKKTLECFVIIAYSISISPPPHSEIYKASLALRYYFFQSMDDFPKSLGLHHTRCGISTIFTTIP